MTPERAKWYDSLSPEEKRVRLEIKECKREIKWIKEELPHSFGHYCEAIKDGMRRNKILIKALRKQIAMRPIAVKVGNIDFICCPKCRREVFELYCEQCGQKLRWE